MRKFKVLLTAVAALCIMAVSASAAQAVTINGPSPFNAGNTGPAAGTHTFRIGTGLVVNCSTMSVTGGTHNGTAATVRPAYSGCNANIGGVPFPATVTVSTNWTLTPTTLNAATGAGTGSLVISNSANPAVKVDIGANCDVLIPGQTLSSGITSQNLTAANTNAPANGAAANLLINANVTNITGTTAGCPAGIPTSYTNASYVGKMYAAGLFLS